MDWYKHVWAFVSKAQTLDIFPTSLNCIFRDFLKSKNAKLTILSSGPAKWIQSEGAMEH